MNVDEIKKTMECLLPAEEQIVLPVPSQVHHVQQQTENWLRAFGLFQSHHSLSIVQLADIVGLAAALYPQARPEALAVVTNWLVWFFLLDVQMESSLPGIQQQLGRTLLAVLDETAHAGEPFAEALTDIWQRVSPVMSQSWRERFREHLAAYLADTLWEARNRENRVTPTLQEYLQRCRNTRGAWPIFDLLEYVLQVAITSQTYVSKQLQFFLLMANNLFTWTDEVYSFEQKYARADMHNLLLLLSHSSYLSHQEALKQTKDQLLLVKAYFTETSQELLASTQPRAVLDYVAELYMSMQRYLYWTHHTRGSKQRKANLNLAQIAARTADF